MAAGATYEPIATTTLGSAQASVTFSSISGSYTDLVLVVVGKRSDAFDNIGIQFNSDTGSNYSRTILVGDGSATDSSRSSNQTSSECAGFGGAQGTIIYQIQNYSNTTTYKTVLARSGDAASKVVSGVGLWRSTSAITSTTVIASGSTFISGTMFTLYGIAAA